MRLATRGGMQCHAGFPQRQIVAGRLKDAGEDRCGSTLGSLSSDFRVPLSWRALKGRIRWKRGRVRPCRVMTRVVLVPADGKSSFRGNNTTEKGSNIPDKDKYEAQGTIDGKMRDFGSVGNKEVDLATSKGKNRLPQDKSYKQSKAEGKLKKVVQRKEQQHGLVRALFTAFRAWERQKKLVDLEALTEEAVERAVENAEAEKVGERSKVSLADVEPYLRSVGIVEVKHLRMLSNLCALTYFMDKVTETSLWRRHRLKLITSSMACEKTVQNMERSPWSIFVDGDATSADVGHVLAESMLRMPEEKIDAQASKSKPQERKIVPEPSSRAFQARQDTVAYHLSAAGQAAAHAAAVAAGSVRSASLPIANPIAGNISYFNGSKKEAKEIKEKSEDNKNNVSIPDMSPTQWYIADDERNHIRYIVIQGSDNMDHWRVNLTFDPVQFEDPSLGVKAHRGVYQAACQLYDRFLPLIQDHLGTHPNAIIAFTGHSLGGSLGTMLMMMYLHRGILDVSQLAPVHTFGSPAVFCGGEACFGSCSIQSHTGVLEKLGLPHDAVRNVMMHRDIVPRAFACDYSLVAEFLRSVHESFRKHHCLSGEKRVMFNTIGQTLVLQPDEKAKFVNSEGYHQLLPQKPGIFALKYLTQHKDSNLTQEKGPDSVSILSSPEEAYWELMNSPHPLDILGDPGAYGDGGSISRYHNPDNYTRALGGVLRARGKNARDKLREFQQDAAYCPVVDKSSHTDALRHTIAGGKSQTPRER